MDDGLKQRIIGAFVLLAIAVIFVSVFFDRERIEPVDRTTLIPPAPSIEPVVIDRPVPQDNDIEPAKSVEEMFVPVVEATPVPASPVPVEEPAPKEKPPVAVQDSEPHTTMTDKGVPQGWVLQIASYQSAERAIKMRDELIKDGYKAYLREVRANGGRMSRVYVGPKLDRDKLEKEKAELDKKYNIETLLLKFDP